MENFNWFQFAFDLFERLTAFTEAAFNFLNWTFAIPGLGEFTMLQIIGGAGFAIIVVAILVKVLVPIL